MTASLAHDRSKALAILWVSMLCTGVGCAVMPIAVRQRHSGLLQASDGTPVAGAKVTVRSWALSMPGAFRRELATEMVTATDAEGRWAVPSRYDLKLAILLPEAGPVFGDEVIIESKDGKRTVMSEAGREASKTIESGLRATVDDGATRFPRLVSTAGIMVGADEKVSVYLGGLAFFCDWPIRIAVRGDLRPGIAAGSVGAGIALLPAFGQGTAPFPGAVLGYRYVRRWSSTADITSAQGPEVSVSVLALRLSVMAGGPAASTPFAERDFTVSVGFGYL